MSNTSASPTIVITDTDRLSAVADAILVRAGNPKLTKNTVLNAIAGALVGPKTNWGGLKSLASPVQATAFANGISPDAEDEEIEPLPCKILGADLIFAFHHTFGTTCSMAMPLTEIPAMAIALFAENGSGEHITKNVTLGRWDDEQLVAESVLYDDTSAELCFNATQFRTFLADHRQQILDAIIGDNGPGETLHHAFTTVAKSQGNDILFDVAAEFPDIEARLHDEETKAHTRCLDQACREAVWMFLADASMDPKRLMLIRRFRRQHLFDLVIDKEWPLLSSALRSAFARETNT